MSLIPSLPDDTALMLKQFISYRFHDSGAERIVIGLSGGLDSALNLKLAAGAVGPEKIDAYFMPYGKLSEQDERFAIMAAEESRVRLRKVEITGIVDGFPVQTSSMAKGNLMARSRMMVLYAHANMQNGMVIGTSNKTELLMGYFTKFGDGAADIYPTGDLFKTQARKLAKNIGVNDEIMARPPSAGLLEDQTDEGELGMPYPILDQILSGILQSMPYERIISSMDHSLASETEMKRANLKPPVTLDMIKRIDSVMKSTRHKRCGLAIPKVNTSTIGIDLRERW